MPKRKHSINSYRYLRSLRAPGQNVNNTTAPGGVLIFRSVRSEEAFEVIGAAYCQRIQLRIRYRLSLLPVGAEKDNSDLTAFGILETNGRVFVHRGRGYYHFVSDFVILNRNLLNISRVIVHRDFTRLVLLTVIGASRGHLGRHNLASLLVWCISGPS